MKRHTGERSGPMLAAVSELGANGRTCTGPRIHDALVNPALTRRLHHALKEAALDQTGGA